VAVSAATGDGYSTPAAVVQFLVAAAGGVLVGVLVAWAVRWARRWSQDPLVLNAVSLATPFVAYLLGEEVHVSGVLSVVVAGLMVGYDSPRSVSGASRLQVNAVWRLVDFLLEGMVFLLIGQQLPTVVGGLDQYDAATIATASAISVGVVLVLRPLWLAVTQLLPRPMHTRLGSGSLERLTAREVLVLSWAGTRGVITLAAIYTLPLVTDTGAPFPDRDLLLFCAFLVVLVTLVGQGTTFAPLVRALGLRADAVDQARLRNRARSAAAQAGLDRLAELRDREHGPDDERAITTLRTQLENRLDRYRRRLDALEDADDVTTASPSYEAALRMHLAVIEAEREELLRLREAGQLPDSSLRVLERELDHREVLLPARRR
jgi:CPA1 family monovalent cation:H+ antiporter